MLRFVDLLVDLLRAKNVPKTYFGGNVQMPKICVSVKQQLQPGTLFLPQADQSIKWKRLWDNVGGPRTDMLPPSDIRSQLSLLKQQPRMKLLSDLTSPPFSLTPECLIMELL